VIEKHWGKKLDWFFDEWVFDTGLPAYTADYKIESSGTEFTIQGTIKQSGVPDGFTMPVPLYGDDEYLGTVQVGDAEGEFLFRMAKKPERIAIDPQRTILTAVSQ
jgi:aminopeptidase N